MEILSSKQGGDWSDHKGILDFYPPLSHKIQNCFAVSVGKWNTQLFIKLKLIEVN